MELTERVQTALQASVVFLDIIGYSKRDVAEQFAVKKRFNADVAAAVAPIPPDSRLMLDTGDGAALCFFSTPMHALDCVTHLIARFVTAASSQDASFEVRTGINAGPVRVIRDMNGQLNVVGDAINDGQRIMSFADAGQVLVSRAFCDAVRAISAQHGSMFEYIGVRADKHGKEHVMYELRLGPAYSGSDPRQRISAPFVTRGSAAGWVPGVLETVTTQLEHYMGSAAHGLIQQAAAQSRDVDALYAMLAMHLAADVERAAFLAGKDVVLRMLAQRGSAWPITGAKASQAPAAGAAWIPSPELLAATTAKLARYVGALASVLVRRAAQRATSESDLFLRLAADLESDEDQMRFMDEVRDSTSRRI